MPKSWIKFRKSSSFNAVPVAGGLRAVFYYTVYLAMTDDLGLAD
jgi:hypothetical protein